MKPPLVLFSFRRVPVFQDGQVFDKIAELVGEQVDLIALHYLERCQLGGNRVIRFEIGNGQGIGGKRRPCKKKDANANRN